MSPKKVIRVDIVVDMDQMPQRIVDMINSDHPDQVYHIIETGVYDNLVITSVEDLV